MQPITHNVHKCLIHISEIRTITRTSSYSCVDAIKTNIPSSPPVRAVATIGGRHSVRGLTLRQDVRGPNLANPGEALACAQSDTLQLIKERQSGPALSRQRTRTFFLSTGKQPDTNKPPTFGGTSPVTINASRVRDHTFQRRGGVPRGNDRQLWVEAPCLQNPLIIRMRNTRPTEILQQSAPLGHNNSGTRTRLS